jgi:hypothetical protein
MLKQHTLTPWIVEEAKGVGGFPIILSPEAKRPFRVIAEVYPDEKSQKDQDGKFNPLGNANETAAFVVRAVNAHEELLVACKEALEWILCTEVREKLQQAIAKAEGKGDL